MSRLQHLLYVFGSTIALLLTPISFADVTADLGVTSEFVRDGISQTGGNAAWQAGLTATHNSGFYGGLWGSNVDHGNEDSIYAEWDLYTGVNVPIWRAWSADVSVTRFTFHGDRERKADAYNETSLRLLWDNHLTIGYRAGDDYLGSNFTLHTLEAAYTFQTGSFSVEIYGANHRLDGSNDKTNFGSNSANDYWHFRAGVARSWNNWDYRLSADRTNLGSKFDAGTILQFSAHRYFRLF